MVTNEAVFGKKRKVCLNSGRGSPGQRFDRLGRDGRSPAIVLTFNVIPADAQHFLEHACPIDQGIDSGSTHVAPAHRYFRDAQAELARQEQNFRIETPALNLLQRQNRLSRAPRKCFESALRIFKLQP